MSLLEYKLEESDIYDTSNYPISHAQICKLYVYPAILTTLSALLLISQGVTIVTWMVIVLFTAYYLAGLSVIVLSSYSSYIAVGYASISAFIVHTSLSSIIINSSNVSLVIPVVGSALGLYLVSV